jgi:hypothetical protein
MTTEGKRDPVTWDDLVGRIKALEDRVEHLYTVRDEDLMAEADMTPPEALDALREAVGPHVGEEPEGLEVVARMKSRKPLAHRHLTLSESYDVLCTLFAKIQQAHTDISRSGVFVKGVWIEERVQSLLEIAQSLRARIAELEAREVTGEMVDAGAQAMRDTWNMGNPLTMGFEGTARAVLNAALRKETTDDQ